MPPLQARAIVLRRIPFSETSLVVSLYTREHGKLHGLAKGARRLKSPFEGALEILSRYQIVFLPRATEGLHLLTEAKLLDRFRPELAGLPGLFAAYYVAELLESFTEELGAQPEVFDLAVETLANLQRHGLPEVELLRFELRLLRYLGHLGQFETCVHCGQVIKADQPARLTEVAGGLACPRCWKVGAKGPILTPEVRHWLQALSGEIPWPLRDSGEISAKHPGLHPRIYGQIRGLVSRWVCQFLGRRPRLFPYLEKFGFFSTDRGELTREQIEHPTEIQ